MTAIDSTERAARQRNIVLSVIAVALYWAALYLYRPTLSTYVNSKVSDLTMVGSILSMYGLGQMLIRLPLGIASDWVGRRKPFIVVGLLLATLGSAMMGLMPTAGGLLSGHMVVGFAAGTWVPMVVLFSSLFPPKEAVRASALLTLVSSLSRMVATGMTGFLNDHFGYAFAFLLAAGAATLAAVFMLPTRETPVERRAPTWSAFGRLLVRPDVLVPSLLSMVYMYASWASTYGFVPILARELGATDVMISTITMLNLMVTALCNWFASAFVQRLGERPLVYLTFVAVGIGVAGAAWAPNLAWILVSQLLMGVAHGVGYPVLMGLSIRDVEESQRTTAMGLHQSIYAIGMFAGPALTGVLAQTMGIGNAFYITAIASLLIGVLGTQFLRAAPARSS